MRKLKLFFSFSKLEWGLLSSLLLYLLLRAAINEPLHDEIATYYFYFYHGDFIGSNIVLDANNHVLNSIIGFIINTLFGENFFLFRLPNVLSFVLFFWAAVQVCKLIENRTIAFLALLALCSPPYYLEYFAYARGYGMSMAFYLSGLLFFLKYMKELHLKQLVSSLVFLWFGLCANLTLINSILLLCGLLVLLTFMHPEFKKHLKRHVLVLSVFVISIVPLIIYSIVLKETGALYYGGKLGLWGETGASLFKSFLFWTSENGFYFCVALLMSFALFFERQFKKQSWSIFQNPYGLFFFLFFGNLVGILALAILMDVNYPQDRTAMYLLPLSILLLAFGLDKMKTWGPSLSGVFLFFPISLVAHLSLHTSIFSPDDRMTNEFYSSVKKHIKPEHSISVYGIMSWNWPRHESHQEIKSSTYNLISTNKPLTDIIVTKTTILKNPLIPLIYDTIAHDPLSTYIAFKRKGEIKKSFLFQTEEAETSGTPLYFDILNISDIDTLGQSNLQLDISGYLKCTELKHKLNLTIQVYSADGQVKHYYYPFEMVYNSQIIDEKFMHHFVLDDTPKDITQIKAYIWNRTGNQYSLKKAKCAVYRIEDLDLLPEMEIKQSHKSKWR